MIDAPGDYSPRFMATSQRDLSGAMDDGALRQDLYYRLHVLPLTLPPLRERRDDIPLLLEHFLQMHAKRKGKPAKQLTPAAIEHLTAYHWPGNVRELQNLVERHVALADGPLMHLEGITSLRAEDHIDSDLPTLAELERRYIQKVLDRFNQSREKTAETLGINKSTLWRKLQSYKDLPADEK